MRTNAPLTVCVSMSLSLKRETPSQHTHTLFLSPMSFYQSLCENVVGSSQPMRAYRFSFSMGAKKLSLSCFLSLTHTHT